MTKKDIKKAIWMLEYYGNGYDKLGGVNIKVVNLKVAKTRVFADIITVKTEDKIKERVDNCEYTFNDLERVLPIMLKRK
jgi:hypothetical protein